ncbi:MAG: alanine racemase [Planctomycetes bacterium]|nr:alanine racemase [Planctomycetota bacterium]
MELDAVQTPALLVRLDRVRANLAELLRRAGGPERLRPHLKTTKIPQIWALLLDAGIVHFKCATTKEAAALLGLAESRGDGVDLLVAHALRGPNLARLAALAAEFPRQRLALLCEDPAHAAEAAARGLGLFLDLDPGSRRSGVPLEQAERAAATAAAAGEALRGWHYYEGEVRDRDSAARQRACFERYGHLLDALRPLEAGVGPTRAAELELVTSGTPAFDAALAYPGFRGRRHRVSAGTVVFHDLTSEGFGLEGFRFAATVLATVASAPAPGHVTLDAGSKGVDAACGTPCCAVLGWPGLEPQEPSEEHLPLVARDGRTPPVGARVELVPRHVCPTVNLYDEALLMEGEEIVAVVPVAARGHSTVSSTARSSSPPAR